MTIWHLEVKNIKVQHSPIYRCPCPQNNADCTGKFIKTRRWQHECVACLKLHGTINKHPLLYKITHTQVNLIYLNDGKKRTEVKQGEEKA